MSDLTVDALGAIQARFHELIRSRAPNVAGESGLQMPLLDASLRGVENKAWFPVPGMYGGFSYWFEKRNADVMLICESWSRVVEGSGQRHEIKSHSVELVDEGFV